MPFQSNFHTHTRLCKHATGDPVDYVRAAEQAGFKKLGFSDHIPFPDNRWTSFRMNFDQLQLYFDLINQARESGTGLTILTGFETEWVDEYKNYMDDLKQSGKIKYMALGNHWFKYKGKWIDGWDMTKNDLPGYAKAIADAAASGLVSFIAHPDIFIKSHPKWDENTMACAKDIFDACIACNVPLEINTLGLRRPLLKTREGMKPAYPYLPFWQAASQAGVKAVIHTDAHNPEDTAKGLEEAFEFAEKVGIEIIELFKQE